MTLNDIRLCDHMRPLIANVSRLELLVRNGQLSKLAEALANIQKHAREAEWIVNDHIRPLQSAEVRET